MGFPSSMVPGKEGKGRWYSGVDLYNWSRGTGGLTVDETPPFPTDTGRASTLEGPHPSRGRVPVALRVVTDVGVEVVTLEQQAVSVADEGVLPQSVTPCVDSHLSSTSTPRKVCLSGVGLPWPTRVVGVPDGRPPPPPEAVPVGGGSPLAHEGRPSTR